VNVNLRLQLTCLLFSAICCRLCLFRVLLDESLFFFSIQPYRPFAIAVFFHEEWPSTPSGGTFHMTAAVTSFPLSKVAGRVLPLLSSLAGLFIYSLPE
jgi:hypothetical protein